MTKVSKEGSNRNHAFDAVRGFAILAVIADHCHLKLPPVLDYFEVPAFFMIAGILLNPATSFLSFIRKKALRLVLPYLFYAFLFVLLVFPITHTGFSSKGLALAFLRPDNAPLWFLKALFWGFVFWRIGFAVAKERFSVQILFALMSVCAAIGMGYVVLPDWFLMTGAGQGIIALPLLWIGFLASQFVISKSHHFVPTLTSIRFESLVLGIFLLLVAFLVVHGSIHLHVCDLGNPLTFYPFVVLVFAAVFLLVNAVGRIEPVEYLGMLSLPLFCIHAIVIVLLESAGLASPWPLYLVTLLISILLCVSLSHLPIVHRLHLV